MGSGLIPRLLGRLICGIWFRLDVHDERIDSRLDAARVIVGNHSSPFDFVLGVALFGMSPGSVRYMVAAKYFSTWWSRPLLRCISAIPVEPSNGQPAVRPAIRTLLEGRSVVVMPEGRIGDASDELAQLAAGAVFIALHTDSPLTVVTVSGLRDRWPVERKIPRRPTIPRRNVCVFIRDHVPTGGKDLRARHEASAAFERIFRTQMEETHLRRTSEGSRSTRHRRPYGLRPNP